MRSATLLEMIASVRRGAGRQEEARQAYDEAAELWGTMASASSPESFRLQAGRAATLVKERRFDEAETALLDLVELADSEGREPVVLFQVLHPLELLYRQSDRPEEAAEIRARLAELREALR